MKKKLENIIADFIMNIHYHSNTMNEAIGIGFFQFDNLIKNRIPCAIFNEGIDFSQLYGNQEIQHINRYSMDINSIESSLESLKYRKIDPVLFICPNGSSSEIKAQTLAKKGYINCYFLIGGFAAALESSRE